MDGRPLAGYVGANHGSSFRALAKAHRTQLDTSMHYGPVELVSRNLANTVATSHMHTKGVKRTELRIYPE